MKKIWKMLLLAATLTVVLSISAFAAEINTGIYDVQSESGVTLTPQTKKGNEVEPGSLDGIDGAYYANAERVEVKLSGATEGKFYLIVAMEDDNSSGPQYPTESNKPVYINQETAASGSVILNVYPSQMENGETYNVYVSSNDGSAAYGSYEKVASFKYHYAEAQAPYTPGDVDNNGKFTSTDALYALQMSVGLGSWDSTQKLAAEVSGDGKITSTDALNILQRSVGLLSKFPVEG